MVARALALTGRTAEAREILDLTDAAVVDPIPFLVHARLTSESCVLAAEGRSSDAIAAARAASNAAEDTPTLHARDLYQLLALGEQAEEILPALRHIAETTSVPSARVLTDRASELVSARTTDGPIPAFEAVRMGAVWGIGDGEREWARRAPTPGRAPGMLWVGESGHRESVLDLTRREREIALLVSEGLSNREIATRLYLSVRTVESHIYQARAKVDARTRGDLGRLVEQNRRPLRGSR